MKKVIVKNLAGTQTHGAMMEDPQLWIDNCVATGVWGELETYTVEIEDVTQQLEQDRINRESQEYLGATDWMIIRELDSGIPCPVEVKQARAEARARIVR